MVKKNTHLQLKKALSFESNQQALQKALNSKNLAEIRMITKSLNELDVAEWMEKLTLNDQVFFLRSLDNITASEIFNELNDETVAALINKFSDSETKELIKPLYSDDVLELIEDLPSNLVTKILTVSSKEQRKDINYILNYQEGTVGYEMNVNFVTININDYVVDFIKTLDKKQEKKISEDILNYYVVDDNQVLIGYIQIEKLLKLTDKEKHQRIAQFMETDVLSIRASDNTDVAVVKINKYSLSQLPVIDNQNKLVGVLTGSEVIQLIKEEHSEDINKQAGIIQDSDLKYFEISVLKTFFGRIPWLLITILISIISQIIFTLLLKDVVNPNKDIKTLKLIISFLPFILTIVGNIALQSSTIVIKSLILKEIQNRHYWKVIIKELKVVFLIFLTIIFLNLPRIFFVDLITDFDSITKDSYLGSYLKELGIVTSIICAAIFFSVFFSTMIPITASRFGFDPTLMSSPLLTTMIDLLVSSIAVGSAFLW